MIEPTMGAEGLPPLPDDDDAAQAAKRDAERRLTEVRQSTTWYEQLVGDIRDMRLHNGFGPRLEEAYRLRSPR